MQHIFGRCFTEKPIFRTRKMKNGFLCKENENFFRQHCYPFQYACMCAIWDHLDKICHGYRHNISNLCWKPRIFVHERSFLWTLFENIIRFPSLLFFLETRSHIMTLCEGFTSFWFFFNSMHRFQNTVKTGGVTVRI